METPISDLINSFMNDNQKQQQFWEQEAIRIFLRFIPPIFENNVTKVSVNNGILFVQVNNASLRFDLMTHHSDLINAINENFETKVINDVIIR